LFNHLLNDILHYWLSCPDATIATTEQFALDEQLIAKESNSFREYLCKEMEYFKARTRPMRHPNSSIHKQIPYGDNSPVGSNPFMEIDDEDTI